MTKMHWLVMALAAAASVKTADDPSYLAMFAETHVMRMAGQKVRPAPNIPNLPPGIKLPPGFNRSAIAGMSGAPTRSLTVRLWSPTLAPDSATASISPPSGLKLGDKLNLDLYRPMPVTPTGGGGGAAGGNSSNQPPDFTIKIYWGSSATVQPGQPKVYSMATMTPAQQMEMGKQMRSAMAGMRSFGGGGAGGASYFYKDNWTTGYWPTPEQTGDIPEGASLPGSYTLNSSYAGTVTLDAPSSVDFLAPINLSSPNLDEKPSLEGALALQWDQIPKCLGLFATAMGMEGKNTMIIWLSSDNLTDQAMSDTGFLQMSEVTDMVQKHVFMSGDQTTATIPAGIFANADMAMLSMVGYGPGVAGSGTSPIPRLQTKTTLMAMLGGKRGR